MTHGVTTVPFTVHDLPNSEYANRRFYIDEKKSFFFLKRVIDIVIAIFAIVFVLTWLTPILALIIKLDSHGAVFFVQKRVGRAGRTFFCFKYRTMKPGPDAHIKPAGFNDPRVTSIGRILRRYNIDELPQFVNVLLGDMSIVGPRPHMHADCATFSASIPAYKFRTFVKPGITGLAQARGFHGPASSQEMIQKRFELDAFYIRNASIELDLNIIQTTISQRIRLLVDRLR